ncbi:MAG: TonB family protein [Bacteroidales bacterium]|nr:TonB family protein [Bacteroidales bacterium]
MKRLFALLIASVVTVGLGAQYRTPLEDLDDSETVRALKEHVATLSGAQMEGRKAGSEGEKMAADYLEACLKEMGIDILTAGNEFKVAEEPDTLTSRNVVGYLEGWDKEKKDHYIVIGARMDNLGMDTYMLDGEKLNRIYYGANGNASGMALLLELARKLSYSRSLLRRSILFVGFGASARTFAGSWYFLNRTFASDADKVDAMVNLDMLGTAGAGGLQAFTASNGDLNALISSLQGELLPIQASVTTTAPYPGDQIVFYDREIPSVLFSSGRYPEHATGRDTYDIIDFDGMERELEYIYSFVQHLANGPRPLFRNSDVTRSEKVSADVYAYSDVDVKPMFLNSADPRIFMERWVYPYLKYPKYASENGIQGTVLVEFVIDEKGEVGDVRVVRGIHESLDAEALRVVSASPKWRPGRHHGKKVKVSVTVSVEFRLDKGKGKFGINGVKLK